MTLWQFMSVAWMAPLISLGKRKQLNDEDVWLLPYEFQHNRLHYLFRDVQGSVIKRLLKVNGLDLVVTTLLGILESVASIPALRRSRLGQTETSYRILRSRAAPAITSIDSRPACFEKSRDIIRRHNSSSKARRGSIRCVLFVVL